MCRQAEPGCPRTRRPRIGNEDEDNGCRYPSVSDSPHGQGPVHDEHIHPEAGATPEGARAGQPVMNAIRVALLDDDVLALKIAEFP